MTKVVILGGGIGGLSAAHELIERGFRVDLYEQRPDFGGKARSYDLSDTGTGGRKDLPAEHGFRYFPGFYRHLPDTMKRIPHGEGGRTVFDNLVAAGCPRIARKGREPVVAEAPPPTSLQAWSAALRAFFHAADLGIPSGEILLFVRKLLVFLTSCQERRLDEYERISWWTFIEAEGKSAAYQRLFGEGRLFSLGALPGRQTSARTMGNLVIQLLQGQLTHGHPADRVLNGPTHEVWIKPWVRYLAKRGVNLYPNATLLRINANREQITSVTVSRDGAEEMVSGDHYLCALPLEVMRSVLTDALKTAAPSLAYLDRLHTKQSGGCQLYLRQDPPALKGQVIYADSAWGLSSISQRPFWSQVNLEEYGDGRVRGLLSATISDWETPGDQVVYRPAAECTEQEIIAEVWAQIKAHLKDSREEPLSDDDLLTGHLDVDAGPSSTGLPADRRGEPQLVNTPRSWQYRPQAGTEIANLFLAADYVQTHTDLASMEGANEAARRAVNRLLAACRSGARRCEVWPLEELVVFAPLRAYDLSRFRVGFGHSLPGPGSLLEPVKRILPGTGTLWEPVRRRLPSWQTPLEIAQELSTQNQFEVNTLWKITGRADAVWELVAEPCTYPVWWPAFRVAERANAVEGVGAAWDVEVRSDRLYRLRCRLELVWSEPDRVVEWRLSGDVHGRLRFELEAAGDLSTQVWFRGAFRLEKLGLKVISPVARPVYERDHLKIARAGAEGLQDELARRAVYSLPVRSVERETMGRSPDTD